MGPGVPVGWQQITTFDAFKEEVERMHLLNGFGISPWLYSAWSSADGTEFYLLMGRKQRDLEVYTQQLLADGQRPTMDWLEAFAAKIDTALQVMQARQVQHSNLAPKNIMVEVDGSFVLVGWGRQAGGKGRKGYIGPTGAYSMTYAFSRILLEMICIQQGGDPSALRNDDFEAHHNNERNWMDTLRGNLQADPNPNTRLVDLLNKVDELRFQ